MMRKTVFRLLTVFLFAWCGACPSASQAADGYRQEISDDAAQEWRMLPGESLQSLAALFYPRDGRMQQRFVDAALAMNRDQLGNMAPAQPFAQATTIRIPELRALSWQGGGLPPDASGKAGRTQHAAISPQQARKKELEMLKRRSKALEERSKAMQQALATAAPPADEAARKPLKRVQAPAAVMPAGVSAAGVTLAILTAVLLLVGFAGYRWHWTRTRGAAAAGKFAPAERQAAEATSLMSTKGFTAAPAAGQAGLTPAPPPGSIAVDEIESVVEEARFIVALGRTGNAIKLLTDHIATHPRTSVNPWLYLLDLYRATGNRQDFAALGQRMHVVFNVMVPEWESAAAAMAAPVSLEEFPHVMRKIAAAWGKPECGDYLNSLIQDNRDGERTGFSLDVLQEILLLLAILEIRDSMPGLGPG